MILSFLSRMLQRSRVANPLGVRQAPDNKALSHPTQLVVASQELSTPPEAQQYFEPGVNTKLTRRRKPKTNYTLPSDMPTYPLGFVPTNQTPGANGEEPPEIKVKEAVPADLLDMFAKISAQQAAESKAVEEAKVIGALDIGTIVARQYRDAMTEKQTEARVEKLVREGYSADEVGEALRVTRLERAIQTAKEPIPSAVVSVETALAERFPRAPASVVTVESSVTERPLRITKAQRLAESGQTPDEIAEGKRLEREGMSRLSRIQAGLPPFELPEEVAQRQGVKDVASAIRQAMARKSKE